MTYKSSCLFKKMRKRKNETNLSSNIVQKKNKTYLYNNYYNAITNI